MREEDGGRMVWGSFRFALVGPSTWRIEVVAASLRRRGLQVCGTDEADVVVVLRGASTGDLTRLRRGRKVILVEGGAPSPESNDARELPVGCSLDRLVALAGHPSRLPRQRAQEEASQPALSSREREVLGHLARGRSNAEIAIHLSVSPHTVRTHVQNVLGKLRVPSRAIAVAVAHELALL